MASVHEVWNGDSIDLRRAGRRGTLKAAHHLLGVTMPRVPIETGRLRSSGQARTVRRGDDEAAAEVSFDTDYAVFVHEILDNHHPQGEAKFLENALNDTQRQLLAIIVAEVRAEMNR